MLYLLFSGEFIGQYLCDRIPVCNDENQVFQTSDFFSIGILEDLYVSCEGDLKRFETY